MPATKHLEIAPDRLTRWLGGFADRHGGPLNPPLRRFLAGEVALPVTVRAGDGSTAELQPGLAQPVALVLVRRGGYAVGLLHQGELVAHKCGKRYVQSRTAAGGWSQQRYSRRRGNQADALVEHVADEAVRVVLDRSLPQPISLVLGGDRALATTVLEDDRLSRWRELPRRELYDLPDPSFAVLREAAERAQAIRILLQEESPGAPGRDPSL